MNTPDADNGGLYFGSGVDKKQFLSDIDQMERRAILFGNNVVQGNKEAQKAFDRLGRTIGQGNLSRSIDQSQARIEAFVNSSIAGAGRLQNAYNNVNLNVKTSGGLPSAGALPGQLQQASREVDNLNGGFSNLTRTIGAFLSIQAGTQFVTQLVKIRGEFQQLEVAYNTILGNKAKADQLMAETVQLAAITPFNLRDVATSTKQLLAYGFASEDVTKTLSMLGDVAAGVSAPIGDIAYLYGTLQTQGRAYTRDLIQFTTRGIPIIAELAKQFGVAESEVYKLAEEAKISFPDIEKAFKSLTGQGGIFFNLMEEQSKTLTGQISNLGDAYDVMLNNIGKANEGILSSGIAGVALLVKNYEKVLSILGTMIAAYGAYRAALILTTLAERAKVVEQIRSFETGKVIQTVTRAMTVEEVLATASKKAMTAAQSLLNSTLLANPYVLVATLLAAAAAQMYFMRDKTVELKSATELLNEAAKNNTATFREQEGEVRQLAKTVNNQSIAESVRLTAYNKLKEIAPEILRQLTFQEAKTRDLTGAVNEYIVSLRNRIALEANQKAYAEALKQEEEANQLIRERNEELKDYTGYGAALRGQALLTQAYQKLNEAQNIRLSIEGKLSDQLDKSGRSTKEALKARAKQIESEQQYFDKNSAAYKRNEEDLKGIQSQLDAMTSKTVKLTNAQQVNAAKSIDELDNLIKSFQDQKNKAETQALRDSLANDIIIAKQRKDSFDKATKDHKDALKQQKKDQTEYARDREKLFKDLEKAEASANARSQAPNEKEKQEARNRYAQLRKEAERLKLGSGVTTRIDNVEQTVVGNIQYRYETDELVKNIDRQKDIYQDFEAFKSDLGEEEARKRFANEIKEFDSYAKYLKAEEEKLSNITAGGGTLTGPQQERLEKINELSKRYAQEESERVNKEYADAYQAAMSLEDRIDKIKRSYAAKAIALGEELTNNRKESLLAERDAAIETAKDEVFQRSAIYKQLSIETLIYTREQIKSQLKAIELALKSENLPAMVREQFEKESANLKIALNIGIQETNVKALESERDLILKALADPAAQTEPRIRELKERLVEVNHELIEITGNSNGSTKGIGSFLKGLENNKILEKTSEYLGAASAGFNQLSQALGGTDTAAGYTLDTIGQLAGAAGNLAAGIASGDPVKMISAGIGAVTTIIGIGKRVKEMNAAARAEVAKFYETARLGELEYQALLRDRERQVLNLNALTLKGIQDETRALEAQQKAINRSYLDALSRLQGMSQGQILSSEYKHGTWFRKAKTDYTYGSLAGLDYDQLEQLYTQGKLEEGAKALFEELRRLKEEGADVTQALKEAAQAADELATGTTVDQLASNIIGSLRAGKRGLSDVMNDYKAIIQDALLSTFESDVVRKELQGFYDRLSQSAQSGDGLTPEEIEAAKNDYIATRQRIQQAFDNLSQVTGVDLTAGGAKESGISGEVKRTITEETGTALEGLFRSFYEVSRRTYTLIEQNSVTLKQQALYMQQSLVIQGQIRDFSQRTAANTDRLEAIENSLIAIVNNTTVKPGSKVPAGYDKGLGGL